MKSLPRYSWNSGNNLKWLIAAAVGVMAAALCQTAVASDDEQLEMQFQSIVRPFLTTYCIDCHGPELQEAKLDLSGYRSAADVITGHQTWHEIVSRLEASEMPPADHPARPTVEERASVMDWVRASLRNEATKNAGDPGSVPARRLSNAEYNYTIRDLTGVDIRPTREFPVDPANEAGFDNSADSLSMSPALLNKYLGAAREVVEHLVLKPERFAFAPHPVMTDTDRDKYCVNRIVEFYRRQPVDYADYFFAAWQVRCLNGHDPSTALAQIADEAQISPKYLQLVWDVLNDTDDHFGPIAALRALWQALPAESATEQMPAARAGCQQMKEFIADLRPLLEPKVEGLNVSGIHKGAQAFVLWKNDQYAANRRKYAPAALILKQDATPEDEADPVTATLIIPADEAERELHRSAVTRFAHVFPDTFFVSERGRDYVGVPREKQEKGRLLSAGFHSMMGYYRDDAPLCDLILNEQQRAELDLLWQELDFICSAPVRQYTGFVWFERTDSPYMRDPEFDFARSEDKNVTSESMIHRLSEVYLAKAIRNGADAVPIQAIKDYFLTMNSRVRWVEQARLDAESSHLAALQDFAERCYRRPLTDQERQDLQTFYGVLRTEDGLTHQEAIQDSIVSLLMSPHFLYRLDLAGSASLTPNEPSQSTAAGSWSRQAISDFDLASRLSYFLWGSLPDKQLLQLAAEGRLRDPDVLLSETRRMLLDDRVAGLATEFAGNWLDFRRFESHNSVDRDRFPQFTDALRSSMFQEPVRFLTYLMQSNGSVLDLLYADYTFVDATLARHYGINIPADAAAWVLADNAREAGRGGLIPMSVFLTQNSPGLRTSPVKRGYWVVRRLLGEHIPAPPADVPELPSDESTLGELTLRQTLARHREHSSCAGCHDRFDSIGLVFENFGPIGELRTKDLGGRPVETLATFPDGSDGSNLDELLRYLREHRQADFVDNLCRKLLSFALGRTLLLSDDLLVDELRISLHDGDYRFHVLIEQIVSSPQFLTRRIPNPALLQ